LKISDDQSRNDYAEEADLSCKPYGPHNYEKLVLQEHAQVSFNNKQQLTRLFHL